MPFPQIIFRVSDQHDLFDVDWDLNYIQKPSHILCIHKSFSPLWILMLRKVWRVIKGPSTFLIFKWFLTSMNPLILDNGKATMKGFPTLLTLTGFLSHMNSPMLTKAWRVIKRLSIFFTHIWFLTTVCSLMFYKFWTATKGFSIVSTYIGFSPVWTLLCQLRAELLPNALAQFLHS